MTDEENLQKLNELNEKMKRGRIITHSDFDGLFSALLMCEVTGLSPDDVVVMEPWEVRKGEFKFWASDFVVDLPRPDMPVKFWADHHTGDSLDNMECNDFAYDSHAPSAARVIFKKFVKDFPQIAKYERDLEWADKIDTASYSLEEYKNPGVHSQISLTLRSLDKEWDKDYFRTLLKAILDKGVEETSKNMFVQAKFQYKQRMVKRYRESIQPYLRREDGVLIVDTREAENYLPKGNSIHLFSEFTDARAAVIISKNKFEDITLVHVGENPFFKDKNKVHIGNLMRTFGGGGHKGVGGCEIGSDVDAEEVFQKIVRVLKKNEK